ncbi:MAG: hypothetical protein AAF235_06605, partial [Planctomycetota bacterium]
QREAADEVAAANAVATAEAIVTDATMFSGFDALLRDPGFGRFADSGVPATDTPTGWTDDATLLWYPTITWRGHDVVGEVPEQGAGGSTVGPFGASTELVAAFRERGGVQIGSGLFLLPFSDPTAAVNVPSEDRSINTALASPTTLQLDARLVPSPYSGTAPRFVWDVVPRLAVDPLTRRRGVQAALFVRRIESGVQLEGATPEERTLSFAFTLGGTNGSQAAERAKRLPVGMNEQTLAPAGRGARVGTWQDSTARNSIATVYAHPLAAEAYVVDPGNNAAARASFAYDVIVVKRPEAWDSEAEFAWQPDTLSYTLQQPANRGRPNWVDLVTQPGQLLLDNLGEVRRVTGEVDPGSLGFTLTNFDPNTEALVRVTPRPGPGAVRPGTNIDLDAAALSDRVTRMWQVVFTPQIPVEIRVVDIEGGSL